MSPGLRAHRMDAQTLWNCHSDLSEHFEVLCLALSSLIYADGASLITIFLYMVAELSALQQIINALTGLDGLPALIVQCAVTTIYTCAYLTIWR